MRESTLYFPFCQLYYFFEPLFFYSPKWTQPLLGQPWHDWVIPFLKPYLYDLSSGRVLVPFNAGWIKALLANITADQIQYPMEDVKLEFELTLTQCLNLPQWYNEFNREIYLLTNKNRMEKLWTNKNNYLCF